MPDIKMTGSLPADDKVRRYAGKVIHSLEKYIDRGARDSIVATVALNRVDRPHGNKYEADVTLVVDGATYYAVDSTLNVYAALDIVRLKLARQLQKDGPDRLPLSENRV